MASHVVKDKDAVPDKKGKKICAEPSDAKSKLEQRQFYHSQTFQPMSLDEVLCNRDSEDELDNDMADLEDRQMRSYQQKLDGVILGKDQERFMHMWNSFVRQQRVVADGHVPWACEAFSRLHKQELKMNSSLFWCWRLFLIKLWDYKLVDGSTIIKCNDILEGKETTEILESALVPTAPTPISEKNTIPPPPLDLKATDESNVCKNGEEAEMDVDVDVDVDQSALSEQRKLAADTPAESSQDEDMTESTSASTQKFVRKREVKPTLKAREMQWAIRGGRGSRGGRGRGGRGRGDHGNLN